MSLPLIIDHDAGTNPDDSFAFALLSHLPDVSVLATVSGNGYPRERALLAHRYFESLERACRHFVGHARGDIDFHAWELIDNHQGILEQNPTEEIARIIEQHEEVIYLAIQGLTNLDLLVQTFPALKAKLRVVHMGLSTLGFNDWMDGGTNMKGDLLAAKRIYSDPEIHLTAVGSQTTICDDIRVRPNTDLYSWLHNANDPWVMLLRHQLEDFHMRRKIWPALHDPLTAAYAVGAYPLDFDESVVEFDERGFYRKSATGFGVRVRTSKPLSHPQEFYDWFSELLVR